ncbi:hypothetical protein M3P19_04700 [Muricauda sp. 2012CJ35-5]|uniref:SMODS and SLOG-associating 2TM effector domain-containing protein n=1 Tax=Flagellimonas spongiicola TaxID=2942208 RepID=A0ABT0PPG8_9FLAO|nr:hypothetical protein [Allomuricauda spongiicola]MCL6273295.1 hypothetical protein [Allomuricauda spongiicola]
MDINESKKNAVEVIFEKITYANIIRYLLAAVMLMKSIEYYNTGKIALEVDISKGLFFFIAVGIVFYWIYRPTYYDKFFMFVLDIIIKIWRSLFKNTKVDNYRNFFEREEQLRKEECMNFYYSLSKGLAKSYYTNNIRLKASSIHFFAMSSLTFFILFFFSLNYAATSFLNIFNQKALTFLGMGLFSFVFALRMDIDLEIKELDNIKRVKNHVKKGKKYDELLENIKKNYSDTKDDVGQ